MKEGHVQSGIKDLYIRSKEWFSAHTPKTNYQKAIVGARLAFTLALAASGGETVYQGVKWHQAEPHSSVPANLEDQQHEDSFWKLGFATLGLAWVGIAFSGGDRVVDLVVIKDGRLRKAITHQVIRDLVPDLPATTNTSRLAEDAIFNWQVSEAKCRYFENAQKSI